MDWAALFSVANTYVLLPWAALILLPRGPGLHALVFYLGIGLLSLAYAILLVLLFGGFVDPVRDAGLAEPAMFDFSLAGVMDLFRSEGGVTLGWIHYLAFDLFVGQWIAKDGDHKGVSRIVQGPILFLTLMAGPLGLLIWMAVRERAARAVAGNGKRG
ncbi:ABA4-like family protein [Sphingomicrobium sp. XHP0239]|uniref:ABA4-like family protein n=1 Tax=Sphingomicrobium maritimum TaxID=3133972 RepID=UPI0031CC552E